MSKNHPPKNNNRSEEGVQINKFISASGFCSRREADQLVAQGRVTINERIASATARVQAGQQVAVDGEKIKQQKISKMVYLAFHKPVGITSTTDLADKTNIISYINYNQRIFPIGRLDKDSEGLILLTNDGDVVNKILRAENQHEKEYIVSVDKPITQDFINRMSNGLAIGPSTTTLPCFVKQEGAKKFRIILTQGLNRQIRRMCATLDFDVKSLKRIRVMNIQLGDLKIGQLRNLTLQEVEVLASLLSNSKNEVPFKESKRDRAEDDFSEGKKKSAKAFFGERKYRSNAGASDHSARDKRAADKAAKKQKPSHFEPKDAAKRNYKKR
jgi:23S rRNA pseudouridine2604 synthase